MDYEVEFTVFDGDTIGVVRLTVHPSPRGSSKRDSSSPKMH